MNLRLYLQTLRWNRVRLPRQSCRIRSAGAC